MPKRHLGDKDEARARFVMRISGIVDCIKTALNTMVTEQATLVDTHDAPIWAVKQIRERAQELVFDARVYEENLRHEAQPVAKKNK